MWITPFPEGNFLPDRQVKDTLKGGFAGIEVKGFTRLT